MTLAVILCVLVAVYYFLIFPGHSTPDARAPFVGRNFAHRGLHDNKNGVPENSLAAFRAAMEAGYGCELDVQFTKDKQLIVFHDNDYKRMCGVDKKVWELTLEEAKKLTLLDTDERIPTFREVLSEVDGQNPLIVEIKAEELNMEWYTELCEATAAELSSYSGEWCLESFNPFVVRWARKHLPNITRGFLIGGTAEKDEPLYLLLNAAAYQLLNFICRPQFIAYNHLKRNSSLALVKKLGAFSVMWTVTNEQDHAVLEKEEDTIIFEQYRPPVRMSK